MKGEKSNGTLMKLYELFNKHKGVKVIKEMVLAKDE